MLDVFICIVLTICSICFIFFVCLICSCFIYALFVVFVLLTVFFFILYTGHLFFGIFRLLATNSDKVWSTRSVVKVVACPNASVLRHVSSTTSLCGGFFDTTILNIVEEWICFIGYSEIWTCRANLDCRPQAEVL